MYPLYGHVKHAESKRKRSVSCTLYIVHILINIQCDEAIPACSRCRRLCIPCIGSGERRFTFKTQNHRFEVSSGQRKLRTLQPLYPSPTNEQGRLEKAFLSKVMISDDLQYSLSWAYGSFLVEVPLRLGTNNALDAAARALVSVHTCFSSPSRTMSVQALSQYTQAITALRNSLDNPAQAYSSSTLCAVNILLIAQVGYSTYHQSSTHQAGPHQHANNQNN